MELPEISSAELENSGTSPEGSAPEGAAQEQSSVQEMIDLDKLDKFKYGGREWTPNDLKDAILTQANYTRQRQKDADERRNWEGSKKYYDNLGADLDKIKNNPSLVEEFRKIYPKEFHSYLRYVSPSNPHEQSAQAQQQLPHEVMSRLETLERDREEAQVSVIEKQLDEKFSALGKKYEYADDERVTARAEAYLKNGAQLDDKVLEQIFKADHEKTKKFLEEKYNQKISAQKDANKRLKDSGSGGSIPGQAPELPKNIKEATEAFRRHMGA